MSATSRHLPIVAYTAFLLIDIVILGVFLGGFLAAYVHPATCWWLQIPAAFFPYLSVSVFLATVGVAILKKRWLLGIHLVACILIALRFSPVDRLHRPESATVEMLTIMTLNAGGSSQERLTTPRTNVLQTAAGMSNPDVIGIQGVGINAGTAGVSGPDFVVKLSDAGYKPAIITQRRRQAFYQPVFARIPVKERTTFSIATGFQRSRLFGSVTTLSWHGEEVVLYNLHLRSFTSDRPWNGNAARWLNPRSWPSKLRAYREDFEARAAEAEQVRRVLENEKRPFIVCGDFNSTAHSWVYHHIARGLTNAFSVAGRGWGGTYHARRPLFRIDHVLVSNHWEVHDARVLDSAVSDHRPLVATLSLRRKR